MIEGADIEGDVTIKSGRSIEITRMTFKNTCRDVMCQVTGHKSATLLHMFMSYLLVVLLQI